MDGPSFRLETICIDCADAHVMADFYGRLLGWEPTVGLEAGLRQTIDYFRDKV